MPDSCLSIQSLTVEVPATPATVRDALARLLSEAPLRDLPDDARGTAEIVLAEVLNNVAEHAYAQFGGVVRLTLTRTGAGILAEVEDDGLAMPDHAIPDEGFPDEDRGGYPAEGGYGWFLIRQMTTGLKYSRAGNRNRLCFYLSFQQS